MLEDAKINALASQVLADITRDLNESIYTKLGGELTITWRGERRFGAFASSLSKAGEPPKHRVTICDGLAIQVWRDAEDLCKFLRSIPKDSGVDKLYDFFGDRVKLPQGFRDEDLVKNIFFAAITWVYFHEIGHLMQEHGVIRAEFAEGHSDSVPATDVHDFEAANYKRLFGREALVSHVTELAADFEATHLFVSDLIRHVKDSDSVDDQNRTEVLSGLLYLMVCGLSLIFFRFNGNQPILPTAVIEGSHPNPLVRLEIIVPQIFESLDLIGKVVDHGLDRRELVLLCGKAAFSATLYWSTTKSEKHEFDNQFLLKGLLANPVVLQYLQPIVVCWEEMLPRVKELRRFGSKLGLMTFTESFKVRIAEVITWGNGPEAKKIASSLPDAMT
ncbi:hypothetical protein CLU86_1096 [Acidovorax sp. 62]|uniref:hypothetical protein n=1 Tax=Acidovorax sp. 62 TaxID=2035203 RepID=UPI000C5FFB4D|nr:hypothetical protein [Acidovorax sp. 62]PIF90216.1 hypothetical protein CLU86_1096 [Acidovorax sp. 62]